MSVSPRISCTLFTQRASGSHWSPWWRKDKKVWRARLFEVGIEGMWMNVQITEAVRWSAAKFGMWRERESSPRIVVQKEVPRGERANCEVKEASERRRYL